VVFVFFTAKLISLILQRRDWMKMKKYTFFFLFSQKPLLEILAADLSWETYIGQEEWNRQKGLSNLFERKRFKFFCFILNYHKYWPSILEKRGKKGKKNIFKTLANVFRNKFSTHAHKQHWEVLVIKSKSNLITFFD